MKLRCYMCLWFDYIEEVIEHSKVKCRGKCKNDGKIYFQNHVCEFVKVKR